VTILGLVAVTVVSASACGGDDDETSGGGASGTVEAVAPDPTRVFRGLSAALEAQGLVVAQLPRGELEGAEVGVSVSGDRSGAARSFSTEATAKAYAAAPAGSGEQTVRVGTVVFQAPTQEDADFFAAAYEG
jgi:hypothetical protein